MTVMTDAFKKVFLGLGGNPKELAENNDVGDYIVDLENAIKAYVASQISEVPSQVQSDWDQSDDTKVDYIKNKPTATGPDIVTISAGETLTDEKKALILECLENGGRLTYFGGTSGQNQYYNWESTRIMCMYGNNPPEVSTAEEWLKAGGTSGTLVIIFDCISSIMSDTITASQHSITIVKTPNGLVVNNPT